MNKEEKLIKIIERAEKNGFKFLKWFNKRTKIKDFPIMSCISIMLNSLEFYQLLLIDHDFAKAFWGEEMIDDEVSPMGWVGEIPIWQHHLQQAVISNNILDYYWECERWEK